jgi:hypothetical protein
MSDPYPTIRDFDRVEDRIRQQRAADNLPVVLVEGAADLLVLRHLLPDTHIFPSDGKPAALRAIRQIIDWKLPKVVAVVDRDFEDPTHTADIGESLHPYEFRDLEGMLIELGVLALVLAHQGDEKKLDSVGGAASLVNVLKSAVAPLSALRHKNTAEDLSLSFKDVDLAAMTDETTLELMTSEYCTELIAMSSTGLDLEALEDAALSPPNDGFGARGKDVVTMAGVALRSRIGNLHPEATKEDLLTSQLHSSAGLALFDSAWLRSLEEKLV